MPCGTEIYPFGHKLRISEPLLLQKIPLSWDYCESYGGGTEIRTLGTFRHGSFQDCCNQPLCHPSEEMWGEYIEESLFVKIFLKNIWKTLNFVIQIFLYQAITDFLSPIPIMELEHLVWDDHSLGLPEFLIAMESARKEEIADDIIEFFIESIFPDTILHTFGAKSIKSIGGRKTRSLRYLCTVFNLIQTVPPPKPHWVHCFDTTRSGISYIFYLLFLIYTYPTICSQKFFICFIFIYDRSHIVYPIIEVDIVVYCYPREIHSLRSDEKWETEVACDILIPSPDPMSPEYESCPEPDEPDHSWFYYDKKIDIWFMMCPIHRERVDYCDHLDSWDFLEFGDIFLSSLQ